MQCRINLDASPDLEAWKPGSLEAWKQAQISQVEAATLGRPFQCLLEALRTLQ
ncbi:hypothetical protein EDD41_2061 [Luteococcus japonicus]|uniref:Uncharacterized protein n=1 Tax=Luteococcus japonicus TaxID=33984 RepID=A0A3N1ZVG2_9ACTN|nr:hypothetical protein EDD41_2061 [Luteococcus japonicus]